MPDSHHRLNKYWSSYPSVQIQLSAPDQAGFFNVSATPWAGLPGGLMLGCGLSARTVEDSPRPECCPWSASEGTQGCACGSTGLFWGKPRARVTAGCPVTSATGAWPEWPQTEGMTAGDIWEWRERQPFAPDLPLCTASVRVLGPLAGGQSGGDLCWGPSPVVGFTPASQDSLLLNHTGLDPAAGPCSGTSAGPLSPALPFPWRFSVG